MNRRLLVAGPCLAAVLATSIALWSTIVNADEQRGKACEIDFAPVPCRALAGCGGANTYFCDTPHDSKNCFDTPNWGCTLVVNANPCGFKIDCTTFQQLGAMCKFVNDCTERNLGGL